MKPIDHRLQELFNAAAQAPVAPAGPPSSALETGVLSRWRAGTAEDEPDWLAVLFRRAVIGAALIMVLSILWGSRENPSPADNAVALANYEIIAHLPP